MNYKTLGLAILAFGSATASHAVILTWTGNSNDTGNQLKAKAEFTAVGNVLTIVLTNTSTGVSASPADTLGTLCWNMNNVFTTPSLTNNVAVTAGSSVKQNNAAYGSSYDLNKEYMYNNSFVFAGNSFAHGVSSVGIGIFGTNSDTFYQRMRGQGPAGSSSADRFSMSSSAGTSGAANNFPVVNNSVTFTLLSNSTINLNSINKVAFSFGSNAQTSAVVPEPATMAALGLGVAALIRRKRNK